jgi:hypothetical protein
VQNHTARSASPLTAPNNHSPPTTNPLHDASRPGTSRRSLSHSETDSGSDNDPGRPYTPHSQPSTSRANTAGHKNTAAHRDSGRAPAEEAVGDDTSRARGSVTQQHSPGRTAAQQGVTGRSPGDDASSVRGSVTQQHSPGRTAAQQGVTGRSAASDSGPHRQAATRQLSEAGRKAGTRGDLSRDGAMAQRGVPQAGLRSDSAAKELELAASLEQVLYCVIAGTVILCDAV